MAGFDPKTRAFAVWVAHRKEKYSHKDMADFFALSLVQFRNLLAGMIPSLETAWYIEQKTDGAVSMASWLEGWAYERGNLGGNSLD